MTKSALMYCSRSEMDSSQQQRSAELARKISETFDVTLLLDGVSKDELENVDGVECVCMPALKYGADSSDFEIAQSDKLRDRLIERRDIMLREFERLKPRALVIEMFPFKQYRLRGEVLPLVERARNGVFGECLVVSVTDGIIIDDVNEGEAYADHAASLLDKYFDMVIVNSDPVFARLEEFFQPKNTLNTPLYHTGFVTPGTFIPQNFVNRGAERILVSAGDGRYGGTLFRAAIEAHQLLWSTLPLPMKVVAGELLPEDEWQELLSSAENLPDLTLRRTVPDLRPEIANSRWSLSQCDYNTAVNAISTQTPSLFVPCADAQRCEQLVRAQRLVYWGAGRLLMPHHLNAASLANEIHQLTKFEPRSNQFDLDGASNAARLISQVVYENNYAPVPARPSTDLLRPH